MAEFRDADFEQMRTEALEVLDTDARIPYVRRRGEYLYNFWRDAANPRGLWRRTTLDSYRGDSPEWDVLIDVDELGRADDEKWVWAGATVIEPEFTRALVNLSRGGSDAVIVREFDMLTREFIPDGFAAAGGQVANRLGRPGYRAGGHRLRRRLAHRIRLSTDRQAMASGHTIDAMPRRSSRGSRTDVSASANADRTPGFERTFAGRSLDFWNEEIYEVRGVGTDPHRGAHRRERVDSPRMAVDRAAHRLDRRRHSPTAPARCWPPTMTNSLPAQRNCRVVFEPDEHTCLHQSAWTRDRLLLVTLADVASRVEIVTPGTWQREPSDGYPARRPTR